MASLRSLWSYDKPRQAFKALLLGVFVAIVCGLIITFIWRVPPRVVDEVTTTARQMGRVEGIRDVQEAVRPSARDAARADLSRLIVDGSHADGRALAYEAAWNEAIAFAIERAGHTPVVQLRRMEHWEALLR